MANLRETSKREWTHATDSLEAISTGSLQRIADATEKMAERYTQLLDDNAWLRTEYKRRGERIDSLSRRIAALRGVITKMKRA